MIYAVTHKTTIQYAGLVRLAQFNLRLKPAAVHTQIVSGYRLTVDPVEFRGFRYHTGIALTVYAPGRNEELGRGGRYVGQNEEAATGLTLYPDAILRAAPPRAPRPRCYVPFGQGGEAAREAGFATVAGLGAVSDDAMEARRLNCTHVLRNGTPTVLE